MNTPIRCRLFLSECPHRVARLVETLRRRGLEVAPCDDTLISATLRTSFGRDDALIELLALDFDVSRFYQHCQDRLGAHSMTSLVLFDEMPSIVFARHGAGVPTATDASFGAVLDMLLECSATAVTYSQVGTCEEP